MNLSDKSFTEDEYKLKKCLTKKTFIKEINNFHGRIKLKAHFKDIANQEHVTEGKILNKSTTKTRIPKKTHHPVETFTEATNTDIDAEIKKLK